jgi:hypothetical protein
MSRPFRSPMFDSTMTVVSVGPEDLKPDTAPMTGGPPCDRCGGTRWALQTGSRAVGFEQAARCVACGRYRNLRPENS